MRASVAAFFALTLAACGSSSETASRTSLASSPSPAVPYAVMVQPDPGGSYYVQLVGSDGHGGPWVKPVSRSPKAFIFSTPCPEGGGICPDGETAAYTMPEISVTRTHAYFLDGDTQVRAMGVDGSVRDVKNISAPPNSQVVFSVSPDDQRMAISIITLATSRQSGYSFQDVMYVEDVASTSNRVDLYSSSTIGEWPVAWHGGSLVVGVASPDLFNFENPYGVVGYRVVDPANGQVLVNLDCAQGRLVPAGTACITGGCSTTTTCEATTLYRQDWSGNKTELPLPPGAAIFTAFSYTQLSPAGDRVAAELVTDAASGTTETAVIQAGKIVYSTTIGGPQGWLDDDHLVVANASEVLVVDVAAGTFHQMFNLVTVPQQGTPTFSGLLPPDL